MTVYLPKACLFDLDGLLLDTEPLHGEAWFKAAASFGICLDKNQLLSLRGKKRLDCAKQIVDLALHPLDIQDLLSKHKPISKNLISKAKPMPGAEKLVRWCFDNGMPMALVTSSASESVSFKSNNHNWLKLIQIRVLGDDPELIKGKPNPDPFLLGAKKLGVDPKYCWAFEDSQAGAKSAIDAGCEVWILKSKEDLKDFQKYKSISNIHLIKNLDKPLQELIKAFPQGKNQ